MAQGKQQTKVERNLCVRSDTDIVNCGTDGRWTKGELRIFAKIMLD